MGNSKQIQRRIVPFLIFVVIGVTIVGCDLGSISLDESKLDAVANYFYAVGKEKKLGGDKTYKFLSEKSRAQVSEEEWIRNVAGDNITLAAKTVKVLGDREAGGKKYGLVSVEQIEKEGKRIYTHTWIMENGKWRRLGLPKTREEASKAFQSGDYTAAKSKAEEWLANDPYAIIAYNQLLFSDLRLGSSAKLFGAMQLKRSKDDIIRAMLAINPEDSVVLFCAATYSDEMMIRKSFLKKLSGTSSYNVAAFNVAINIKDPKELLALLDDVGSSDPRFLILRIDALGTIKDWQSIRILLQRKEVVEEIKDFLKDKDSSFAANWGAVVGGYALLAGDRQNAEIFCESALGKDPNHKLVRLLVAGLEKPEGKQTQMLSVALAERRR